MWWVWCVLRVSVIKFDNEWEYDIMVKMIGWLFDTVVGICVADIILQYS